MNSLPHWDLTNVYPSLESPEFVAAIADVERQIDELKVFLATITSSPVEDLPVTLAESVERFNRLLTLSDTVYN